MQIKICGLTDVKEAEYLNRNRVDYAGFVLFFEKSKRNLTIERAKPIMDALAPGIQKVAVTVLPTVEQVKQIKAAGFDLIQIHGVPQPETFREILTMMPVLKAFNLTDLELFSEYEKYENVKGYVFDAAEPGSGKTFDWERLCKLPRGEKLFMLAGGLQAENVQRAIRAVQPDGVDVSSGVEYDGVTQSKQGGRTGKDPEKIDAFVRKVREIS